MFYPVEAAGGKVWSLKRTWQQQENWATTREQGSNKISWDVLRQISARVVAKVLIEVVVSKVVVKEVF
uniref:Uncharacterized protein n=1 Tax=Helianthus annuus TaxID=4232 RepID=A0A251TFX4_HELAN